MNQKIEVCRHCGRSKGEVNHMVMMGNGDFICDECSGAIHEFFTGVENDQKASPIKGSARTPRDIVDFLDEYVIGQQEAKETLAVAVYNHYKRLNSKSDVEIDKSNILLIGPTGTGKTLLAQTIARILDVPFTIADATSLTEAGYVGDDVETILQSLLQAAGGDIKKAERGMVFIDEIDKTARAGAGASITRDVSGVGVQQALLKLIEGTNVNVQVSGNRKAPGAQANVMNTKNILFICAGAFADLMETINNPKEQKSMGFMTAANEENGPKEVSTEMLIKFGMIPEFIGRLPVVTTLNPLKVEDFERILTEPKNSIVRQMQALFEMDDASLEFDDGALRALAEEAMKLKTGARGARGKLEKILHPAKLDVPGTRGAMVHVTKDLKVEIEFAQKLAA